MFIFSQVQLYRAHRTPTTTTTTAAARDDDTKFQFSESMRKTQEAEEERTTATSATSTAASTACCRWWLGGGRAAGDKYAQVVLTTEIDSLKRTLKEVSPSIGYSHGRYSNGGYLPSYYSYSCGCYSYDCCSHGCYSHGCLSSTNRNLLRCLMSPHSEEPWQNCLFCSCSEKLECTVRCVYISCGNPDTFSNNVKIKLFPISVSLDAELWLQLSGISAQQKCIIMNQIIRQLACRSQSFKRGGLIV